LLTKDFDSAQPRDARGRWTAPGVGHDVEITHPDGMVETRTGGTRAWRNNNPGNIRIDPSNAARGAIGSAGGYAVFPDEATGTKAIQSTLQSPKYASMSVNAAVASWAPPKENDTARYQTLLRQWTGLSGDEVIGRLSADQLDAVVGAIKRMEGWQVGTVRRATSPRASLAV
jgi:hypothetical protein